MVQATFGGPQFQVESDRLVIGLGNSERRRVGELARSVFEKTGLFTRDIVVLTINELEAGRGSKKLNDLFADSTIAAHSAAEMFIDGGLQIMAFNPAEQTSAGKLIKRGLINIGQEAKRLEKEPGAHKIGPADSMQAFGQMVMSPITTFRTIHGIAAGHSSSRRLAGAAWQFPAGRAIIHSELDPFQFPAGADLELAARSGVSTAVIPGHGHNELLFAPHRTLTAIMPHILPQMELAAQ